VGIVRDEPQSFQDGSARYTSIRFNCNFFGEPRHVGVDGELLDGPRPDGDDVVLPPCLKVRLRPHVAALLIIYHKLESIIQSYIAHLPRPVLENP